MLGRGKRILVLFEARRGAAGAIDFARQLAEQDHATLTVVSVVPQAASGCCVGSAREYNSIVRETVAGELDQARERLGDAAESTAFELLVEGKDPPLHSWVAAERFDVVLLPARRRPLRSIKHPDAARLRRRTRADVRVIDPVG